MHVLGTLLGILLGIWLGRGLTRLVAATVSELYYNVSVTALHLDWMALLMAAGLGVLATLLATLVPAWRAALTPPLTTLSRAALEQAAQRGIQLWAVLGLLLLGAGLLLALALPGGVIMSFAGLFALVLGAAMLTPMVIRLLHRVLVQAGLHGIWRMGVRDLDRHLSRLGIAVAALMVALSASVGVGVMVESMRGSVNTWLSDLLSADLYVAAPASTKALPCLMPSCRTCRDWKAWPRPAVTANTRCRWPDGAWRSSGRTWPRPRVADLHCSVAPTRHGRILTKVRYWFPNLWRITSAWHPAGQLTLPTPAGPRVVTVAAVFRDYASEHGRLFMDEAVYHNYWPDHQVNTLALFAQNGALESLRREVSELAARSAIVQTPARAILEESMAVFDRTFRVTEVLRMVSLCVAFIGVLSALMALQLERGKEYAVLRALGLTRGQIAGLITGESLLMGLLAGCVAIPTGVLMAWVLIQSVQRRAFGWTMPFSVDGGLLLQTLLIGLLAAGLAAIYPAWRSAQRDPAPQLRED